MNHPQIGATLDDLDTPALCVDLDALERNIACMAALCQSHGVAWRPHAKGHKSPQIARRQVAAGAIGVTCAKLSEAEVMADAGIRDVLVANQIAGPHKVRRVVELARRADLIIAVDHLAQVEPVSAAAAAAGVQVRAIIEVDIGLNRSGVLPGSDVLTLAQAIDRLPGVRFVGIMGYEGHLLTVADADEKRRQIEAAMALLAGQRDQLLACGLECSVVSAGGTGSCLISMGCPGVTELQAGGLVFMDAFYRRRCQVDEFEYALRLLTTVVSRPTPDRAIIDAGRKSQFAELQPPIVCGREDIRVGRLSAEHGQLELGPTARELRIGDRLELIPGYGDFTCVLHNEFVIHRDRRVVDVWPLAARGMLT